MTATRWATEVSRPRGCWSRRIGVLALLFALSLAGHSSFLGPQKPPGSRKTTKIEAVRKDPAGAFGDVPPAQPADKQKAMKDLVGTLVSVMFWAVFIRAIIIEDHYLPYAEHRASLMMEGVGGSQIHVFQQD